MSLPSHAGQGNEGGEEEGEASQNKDAHNDGSEVGERLLLVTPVAAGGAVAVRGGAVGGGGGAVRDGGGAIGGAGLLIGRRGC